jgi:hypothetical protein
MGFYIRRGKNLGPFRLNLSKSGLGISFGVKGARIGLNSQGKAYVHAGRGGLYYRKQLGGLTNKSQPSRSYSDPIDIFVDTGITTTQRSSSPKLPPLATKQPQVHYIRQSWLALIGIFFLLVALSSSKNIPLLFFSIVMIVVVFAIGFRQWRAEKHLDQSLESIKALSPAEVSLKIFQEYFPGRLDNLVLPYFFYHWCMNQIQNGSPQNTSDFFQSYPNQRSTLQAIQAFTLDNLVEEALLDHALTPEEEAAIISFIQHWQLPEDFSIALHERLRMYQQLREQVAALSESHSAEIYFESSGRLLKEKVLRRYQQDRVPYREIGYVMDTEGVLVLTPSTLLLRQANGNERKYSVSKISDVVYLPEHDIVEVDLLGRKSNLLISSDKSLKLAALLAHLTNQGN